MKNLKYLSLLTGTVMLFGASMASAATDDYVNYYPFDEGTGRTVGDSKGGQNGTFTGASTGFGWVSGMIGTALGMDGFAGESVALPDGLLTGSQGSLVVWFKLNTLTDRNIIFSGRSTTDDYIHAALQVNYEGRPQFLFRQTTDGADKKAQGGKILNTNEWYQLIFTADGVGYHMFINGEEATMSGDNIGRWFSDLTNRTLKYRIGALDSNPLTGVFDGYLDDLRIYDRMLTLSDVTELYNGGNPGVPGNPVLAQTTQTTQTVTTTNIALSAPTPAAETVLVSTPAATQAVTVVDKAAERKALIAELIKQILLLIAELQKQLAAMKGQAA
ncbi:MAG: LamG domain-containing protein [bacterium]|nr:LamG domain-containing protein [bacterium]